MLSRPFLFGLAFLILLSLVLRSPLLFLLASLLALVAGASLLWERYCLSGVTYTRNLGAGRVFCGEATDVWLEIVNAKPLPLAWLRAQDEFPEAVSVDKARLTPAGEPHRLLLTSLLNLRWYERVRRHHRLTTTRRGIFDFGPVTVTSGDIFGFRTRRMDVDHRHTLMVYPKIVPYEQLNLRPARPLGDFGAQRRIVEDPLRLAGVRDYVPQDSVRSIHWKATARRGSLQTKRFDPSASHQLFICLNSQTLERAYGGILVDELETAIVAAASIAHAALENGHPVGLVSNGSLREAEGLARLPVSRHVDHELRLLELLAQLTYFTTTPFEQLLRAEAAQFPFGASLLVITTLVTEPILAELLTLRASGHPVALIVVHQGAALPASVEQIQRHLPTYLLTANWTELEALKLD
jgi:uncharacterized protein (DUF58 family)